jgi:tryptophan 7-halogenase
VSAPRELVIVGRDAPAWLSANVVQSALGPAGVRVTVVELPGLSGPADVYATLPALEPLHRRLRIDENRLLAATRGAFTLGMNFLDATRQAPSFFHAFGSTGARIDNVEFLPHWLKARQHGLPVAYEDFCLTAAAAKHGRMLVPDPDIERHGFTDYGYHLPAIPYAAWLKRRALRAGVEVMEARAVQAVRDAARGDLVAVACDGERKVTGDFFIDATGSDALLMNALGVARESWRDAFPADRLLVAHTAPLPAPPAYAEVRHGESGWVALHPSQVCTHVIHAYSSETSDERALANAAQLAGLELHGAQVRRRAPGMRAATWQGNCVAIGAAACDFDALHGVDLQAVQIGLVHLLPLFPVAADCAAERLEYNKNVRAAYERIRDFQSAHYALNRYGGAFWSRARLTPLGAELVRKIGVFRARGDLVHYEDESFDIADWQTLLLGHGVVPETWDPAADRTPPEVVKGELLRILGFIRQKVESQRPHAQFLSNRS